MSMMAALEAIVTPEIHFDITGPSSPGVPRPWTPPLAPTCTSASYRRLPLRLFARTFVRCDGRSESIERATRHKQRILECARSRR